MVINCSPLIEMRALLFFLLVVVAFQSYSQVPVIQKFEPTNTFPLDTILISGAGFDATKTNLEVWFNAVEGEIISSTVSSIEVVVPMEARASNIEVIHKTSRLSGKSIEKFIPTFEGSNTFAVSNFVNEKTIEVSEELWDLCTCDFDGDGRPDVATSKFEPSPFPTPTNVSVTRNTSSPGAINFDPFINLTTNFPTDNIICGDLQGDGLPEMIATRAGQNKYTLHVWKNQSTVGNISFAANITLQLPLSTYSATRMAIRDLNRDGKPEIIVTNAANAEVYIFINQSSAGNLSFTSTVVDIKVASTDDLKTYDIDVQDFDNDGLPDLAVNQYRTSDLYILRNESQGSIDFAEPQKITVPGNFNRIASGDFNNDGLMDIVMTNYAQHRAEVLINKTVSPTFSFNAPIQLSTSLSPWGVETADVNGDHNVDLIVTNINTNPVDATQLRVNVFLNNGAATPVFTRSDITTPQPTRNLKVNDFDGDGKPDIAFTGFNETTDLSQLSFMRNRNCHQARIINEETEFCNPKVTRLQAVPAGNVTFAWEKDGVATGGNSSFIDISVAGTYEVTVTGELGTCVTTDQITMVLKTGAAPAIPNITANTPLCAGQTLNLSSTTPGMSQYIWTGPNGFAPTPSATASTSRSAMTTANAGEYTLQVKAGDGCLSHLATTIVEVSDVTDFVISSSVSGMLCTGSSTTLSINNLPGHTYQWRKNGAATGDTGTSVTVNQDGAYTVFITNTNIASCSGLTDPFDLIVLTAPVASFTVNATLCKGVAASFTNTSQVDSRPTPVYTWNFGDSQGSFDTNPTHVYNPVTTPANFSPALTVSYESVSGCTDSENAPVSVVSATVPTIISNSLKVCPDNVAELSVAAGFTVVQWSTTETTSTIQAPAGSYTVTTLDANGCEAEGAFVLENYVAPVLTVSSRRSSIVSGDTTLLEASGAETYLWSPATALVDAAMATSSAPVAMPSSTTTFTVTGTSSEADGSCTGEGEVTVTVTNQGAFFPLAFSPNGDGDNEVWEITGNDPDCLMTIFDGRGRRIFEKKSENWDGTFDGKPVPEGTYYYVYGCPNAKPVTGTVLVFR
jgi:gliding motility-associated-like protein